MHCPNDLRPLDPNSIGLQGSGQVITAVKQFIDYCCGIEWKCGRCVKKSWDFVSCEGEIWQVWNMHRSIRKIRTTDSLFGFAFCHRLKPLFSLWATFLPRKLMTSWQWRQLANAPTRSLAFMQERLESFILAWPSHNYCKSKLLLIPSEIARKSEEIGKMY